MQQASPARSSPELALMAFITIVDLPRVWAQICRKGSRARCVRGGPEKDPQELDQVEVAFDWEDSER